MFFLNWIIISFRGLWICRKYLSISSHWKPTRIYEYSESEFECNIQNTYIYVFTHVNYLATCICRRKRREISRTGLPLVWSAKMVSYKYFLLHLMLITTGPLCYIYFAANSFCQRPSFIHAIFFTNPLCFMSSFLQILFVSYPLFYESSFIMSTDQPCFMSTFLQIIFVWCPLF